MKTLLTLGMVLLAGSVWAAGVDPKLKTVTVQGEGTASAAPDQATLDVEVQQQGASSKDVVLAANQLMNDVLVKLQELHVDQKDMQTQGYSVDRNFEYTNGKSKPAGYTVTNRLKVVLHQVDQVDDVIGGLAGIEAVQVNGPTFGFADPNGLQIEALKTAVANAHAKAEALAEAAGATLGPVYSIQETNVAMPRPRPMMMAAAKAMVDAAPIEKGTDEVTAQVEVIYTLK